MEEKDINKLVDETLGSIDNIKRANAGYVRYERILSSVTENRFKNNEFLMSFIYKAAAVFILLLTVNIFTWAHVTKRTEKYIKSNYNNSINAIAKSYFNDNNTHNY